jgi:hypothetical protein
MAASTKRSNCMDIRSNGCSAKSSNDLSKNGYDQCTEGPSGDCVWVPEGSLAGLFGAGSGSPQSDQNPAPNFPISLIRFY